MKVRDLSQNEIKVGLRVKGLATGKPGTVVHIDPNDDYYAWILWDDEDEAYSGFYGNNCDCEVIEDKTRPLVLQAAIQSNDGNIHTLPRPARHCNIINKVFSMKQPMSEQDVQGFILENGIFVDRKEAAQIAIETGQIKALKWPPYLYSEDLW